MAEHNQASTGASTFATQARTRLKSAPQQISWAHADVERFFLPPPRRWWRRNPPLNTRTRPLEGGIRCLVDTSGDLLALGIRAELALKAATAATNLLARTFDRTQIADAMTEQTISQASKHPTVPMPWTPTQLEQLLRSMASLARHLGAATVHIALSPTTPADIATGLQWVPILLRELEEQYLSLADKLDNS